MRKLHSKKIRSKMFVRRISALCSEGHVLTVPQTGNVQGCVTVDIATLIKVTSLGRHCVSWHRQFACLSNSLFRLKMKKMWKVRIICKRNSLVTVGFLSPRTSYTGSVGFGRRICRRQRLRHQHLCDEFAFTSTLILSILHFTEF